MTNSPDGEGISRAFFCYYLAYLRLRESTLLGMAAVLERAMAERVNHQKFAYKEKVLPTPSSITTTTLVEENVSLIIPLAAIAAFTIELGIKGLISKTGDDPPHTHDLQKLFDSLKGDLALKLESSVSNGCSIDPKVFREKLGQIRQDFVSFRYPYGSSELLPIESIFAHCLISAIAEVYGFRRN
jgi:HEPN domain-containing protein